MAAGWLLGRGGPVPPCHICAFQGKHGQMHLLLLQPLLQALPGRIGATRYQDGTLGPSVGPGHSLRASRSPCCLLMGVEIPQGT